MNRISAWAAVGIGIITTTVPTFVLFQAVTFLFVVPLALGIVCILLGITALHTQGKLRKHVGWIAVVLNLVAVVVPFGMTSYHNRSGYPIVFVIPEGYRGPVTLLIDWQQGVDIPLKDGKYTYLIPESGRLVIKDGSPFSQWHSTTVMYTSGKLIPIDHNRNMPPDTVSFHSFGTGVRTQGGKQRSTWSTSLERWRKSGSMLTADSVPSLARAFFFKISTNETPPSGFNKRRLAVFSPVQAEALDTADYPAEGGGKCLSRLSVRTASMSYRLPRKHLGPALAVPSAAISSR